ncbi:Dihydrolipoyllysine-residue acetyltransferase component of pyruvate dehydrogenase complex [Arthrobacter saudimassiliensis]|uniref:Dihydrolipoamide acetyltransferase component of pyruvate dehydrogenase complex n=1 Tax=Arthrobacter saudimassiliensis TaxID=1461584 RepID=A0A078MM78_9MICC|nr:Dihydrolipoyllysine-residue acetyltransferase component of pyruvate dehydrogenase complex [Arthrobacter saudimassiliensis]
MTDQTFSLPDVGEGLTEAEIVQWKVKPGDRVSINDVIVEIETAKSLVELPSPHAGVVSSLLVAEGETVDVGTPIIAVRPDGAAAESVPDGGAAVPGEPSTPPVVPAPAADDAQPASSLTGTGPKADAVKRRPRRRNAGAAVEAAPADVTPAAGDAAETPAGAGRRTEARAQVAAAGAQVAAAGAAVQDRVNQLLQRVLAKPPVRKAAKDLGIDLAEVPGTGAGGEVTKQDLLSYQAQRESEQDAADTFWTPAGTPKRRRIERVPVRGVRKATAKAMVQSAFSAPHVSIFVDVDASRTMEFVKRLKASRDFEGIKVSPLLILAKAVIWAAARNPSVNATWAGDEIHVKHFMNLGIAAATPRGLMVPNIKDAQDLSLKELALALNELAATARAGRTKPADMQGGTLTITNIGALGIDTGTPIINPGEVAIVAFGTIKQKPWVLDGEVLPRWVTTLGGSFDHRVVDGDLSARFMADVAAILEEPALLLD